MAKVKKTPQTNRKPATKKGADEVSKTNLFLIPIKKLEVEPDFNQRLYYGDEEFEVLKEDIKQNGIITPLRVTPHPSKKDAYYIREGHRRFKALELLEKAGHNMGKAPAIIVHGETPEQSLVRMLSGNNGKPFSKIEKGKVYAKMESYNIARKDIASMTGVRYEEVCYCLELTKAPHKYHEQLAKDQISHVLVYNTIKKYDGEREKVVEVLDKAIGKADKVAKKEKRPVKVTIKHATELKTKSPLQILGNAVNSAEKKHDSYNKTKLEFAGILYQLLMNKPTEAEILEAMRK